MKFLLHKPEHGSIIGDDKLANNDDAKGVMNMANERVRAAFAETRVIKWQVADVLGVHPTTLANWMRHELPEIKQQEILAAIRKVKEAAG